MVTMQEAANALAAAFARATPYTKAEIETAKWVRMSCEADGLPYHLIVLVLEQVHREMVYGTFPFLKEAER